eukprot:5101714-Ditylum_brightwellii.AAC.1
MNLKNLHDEQGEPKSSQFNPCATLKAQLPTPVPTWYLRQIKVIFDSLAKRVMSMVDGGYPEMDKSSPLENKGH